MSVESFERPLPLLPLRSGMVLPGAFVSLPIGRRRSRALADAVPVGGTFIVGVQRDPSEKDPRLDDLHSVGVRVRVKQKSERGNRGVLVLVEGIERCRLVSLEGEEPYLRVHAGAVSPTGSR